MEQIHVVELRWYPSKFADAVDDYFDCLAESDEDAELQAKKLFAKEHGVEELEEIRVIGHGIA